MVLGIAGGVPVCACCPAWTCQKALRNGGLLSAGFLYSFELSIVCHRPTSGRGSQSQSLSSAA